MTSPILVALDFDDSAEALALARDLQPHVAGFKVGLELMMSQGPEVIEAVATLGSPVFADAKLHDIPSTVAGAARALARFGARWVTVHGSGGAAMIRAAVDELEKGSDQAGVLVVTVLTSLDAAGLADVGVDRSVGQHVVAMAALAAECGAEGVICSPREVEAVKSSVPGLEAVTPGVRTADGSTDDQMRFATPSEAVAAGASYLVIGRPITHADDPVAATKAINRSLD